MKKLHSLFFTAFAICVAVPSFAQDSEGTVSYALPQTTIVFNVEARQDVFYAGPFAKYSAKYLGVEAQQEDKTTREFIAWLKKQPLLKAILCGHEHLTFQDQFSPTAVQYLVGANFLFTGREILFY